jgi:hypothetical protein
LSNAFDSNNYPTQVPFELKLGDFWAWKDTKLSTDYANSAYTLTYEFNLVDGSTPANITFTATADGDDYKVEVASTATASYTKGEYNWVANITRNSDSARVKVGEGFATFQDNYAATSASVRSHAKIVYDAICAVVENRASMDQSSMSIAGRSLSRMSIDELLTFKNHYKAEWLKEVKQARIKNNKGSGNTIKVRFTR